MATKPLQRRKPLPLDQQMAMRKRQRIIEQGVIDAAKEAEAEGKALGDLKPIAPEQTVMNLAREGLTPTLIAGVLEITVTSLMNRFAHYYAIGRVDRATMILQKNFKEALKNNDKALEREMKMLGLLDDTTPAVNIMVESSYARKSDEELLNIIENDATEEDKK